MSEFSVYSAPAIVMATILMWLLPEFRANAQSCPGCGDSMGAFNGVTAYKNCGSSVTAVCGVGNNTASGVDTGPKWHCTEYVQRYYWAIYQLNINPSFGHAKTYGTNSDAVVAAAGLVRFPNGGNTPPLPGDIIVSEHGEFGHVAIVTNVYPDSVKVIHQNWGNNLAFMTLSRIGNTVGSFGGSPNSFAINDWLRKRTNTPSTISPAEASNIPIPVSFSWGAVAGSGIQYRIQVSTTPQGWNAESGFNPNNICNSTLVVNKNTGSANSFQWSGIISEVCFAPLPNTTYYWTVKAFSTNGGSSKYSPVRSFSTACNVPSFTQTSATNIGVVSAQANCSVSALGYQWQYRRVGTTQLYGYTSSSGNWLIPNLLPATAYEFQVRIQCGSTWSEWSPFRSFTTLACSAPQLSQLSVNNLTATSARFNSTAVSGATSYDWRYKNVLSSSWTLVGTTSIPLKDVSTGLTASTNYEFQVRVLCGGTWTAWSASRTFTTLNNCVAPLSTQTSITNIGVVSAQANCSVSAPGYQWQYRRAGTTQLYGYTSSSGNWPIPNLLPATTYEFQVKIQCGSTWSGWSPFRSFTTLACSAPQLSQLSVSNLTATSARFNSTAVSGATSYDWRYKNTLSSSWTLVGTTSTPLKDVSTGLTASTNYEFQVRVLCGGTWTAWSASRTFTTSSAQSSLPNDNPCTATTIVAGSGCTYTSGTNVGATNTTNPAAPASCSYWGKDVWFKVQVPASGIVTVRLIAGTLSNAVMAIYYGSCSALQGIVCEDNNTNGNGSLMPVITITGHNPGTWLHIRIWGSGNTTGTFQICAMNVNTPNLTDSGNPGGIQPGREQNVGDDAFSWNFHPNPTSGILYGAFQLKSDASVALNLRDMNGRVIRRLVHEQMNEGYTSVQFDLSDLPSGPYFIKGVVGRQTVAERIIIFR